MPSPRRSAMIGKWALHEDQVKSYGDVPELPLRRAMVNLLDNARSHGHSPVSVELTAVGDEITLLVFDGGRGISVTDFEQAQEPFVRLGTPSIAAMVTAVSGWPSLPLSRRATGWAHGAAPV